MGSFFNCKSCNNNNYLFKQKEELSLPQAITCSICRNTNTYLEYEIQQERYDLSCPVCNGRFYIRKMPPIKVLCPHSSSELYISIDGSISIIKSGTSPITTKGGTAAGALGGLVIGALLSGAAGALLGTLAGAALGSNSDVIEALYLS